MVTSGVASRARILLQRQRSWLQAETAPQLLRLPDHVEVYLAHGTSSLCGRHMSSERKATIGVQRVTNYALRAQGREAFIALVAADLPQRHNTFSKTSI